MRCALCPRTRNCVQPSGPKCSDYANVSGALFIGEAPGRDEDRHGIPFWGKTGKEVDSTYLPVAGLKRPYCRFINSIACLPETTGHKLDPKNTKHVELMQSCAETNLYPEIVATTPKLLVPMGAFACMAIDPEINLELHHGIPLTTRWGVTFPMYHPASGMHEPKKMLMIRNDWIRLGEYLKGELYVPSDQFPTPDYQEVTKLSQLNEVDPTIPMACDTESSRSIGPFCITYSQYPGTGRLIRSSRLDLLKRLQSKLDRWQSLILFHNWLYDWTVVEEMALRFPERLIRDTMVRSFHLGNLPQGLKALAYRELGMDMQDFDDLVKPYSKPYVLEYYRMVGSLIWPKPAKVPERQKDGSWKNRQPQVINTKVNRFFLEYEKDPSKDVFNMWTENWVDEQEMIEEKLGRWPGPDIAHVPFDEVLHYACRDADATLRLNSLLESMRSQVTKLPQDKWRKNFEMSSVTLSQ